MSVTKRQVEAVVTSLRKLATQHDLDNLPRFGITAPKALGVSVANIRKIAKALGRDHDLAAALWETGCLGSYGPI